jgi:hypothetical protein
MSTKTHAVLITGQLRCVDDNLLSFLDTTKEFATLFVFTDRQYQEESDRLALRYDTVVYFTDEMGDVVSAAAKPTHVKIHPEFEKLELALRCVIKWELANNHTFDFIHRFRTDVIYNGSFADYIRPMVEDPGAQNSIFFANWCTNHSGTRESMLKLIGHPKFSAEYQSSAKLFESVHSHLNIEALRRSSHHRLYQCSLPVAILNSTDRIASLDTLIKEVFPSYIEAAESFSRRLAIEGLPNVLIELHSKMLRENVATDYQNLRAYINQWFPWFPEHIFFMYINQQGMAVKIYSFEKDASQMSLKYERHATTEFTKDIFHKIQLGDYSFLDADLEWEDELKAYVEAGGSNYNLVQKLAAIDLTKVAEPACIRLFKLIDTLNQSDWIAAYAPWFMAALNSIAVEPPQTLKKYIQAE